MANNGTMLASALAYSSFFAIPSVLIVATGLFTLVAGPQTITSLMQHLHGVIPVAGDASLLGELAASCATRIRASSLVMTILGFVLAVWSVTGAMNAYMLAMNLAYEPQGQALVREEAIRRAQDGGGDGCSHSRSSRC